MEIAAWLQDSGHMFPFQAFFFSDMMEKVAWLASIRFLVFRTKLYLFSRCSEQHTHHKRSPPRSQRRHRYLLNRCFSILKRPPFSYCLVTKPGRRLIYVR